MNSLASRSPGDREGKLLHLHCAEALRSEVGASQSLGVVKRTRPLLGPGLQPTTSPQCSRGLTLLFSSRLWWWSVLLMAGMDYFVISVDKFLFG